MEQYSSIERLSGLAISHMVPQRHKFDFPILFIHGAWGGRWQFKNWQLYCTDHGCESYALDLRGHHQSPCNDLGSVRLKEYADDVEEVVKHIGPCYLVGHSMGGLVAQMAASQNPDVKKAVFVASAPPAGIFSFSSSRIAMIKYLPERIAHKPFLLTRRDALRFLLSRLDETLINTFVPESAIAGTDAVFTRIKNIQCPTLVVAAGADPMTLTSIEKRIARKYGSQYIEIQNMAHMIMLEEGWTQPIKMILQWITSQTR